MLGTCLHRQPLATDRCSCSHANVCYLEMSIHVHHTHIQHHHDPFVGAFTCIACIRVSRALLVCIRPPALPPPPQPPAFVAKHVICAWVGVLSKGMGSLGVSEGASIAIALLCW